MNLREYQKELVDQIYKEFKYGVRKLGVQSCTGSGKTAILKFIIKDSLFDESKNFNRIFFCLKGNKLMDQTLKVFSDLDYGLIWSGKTQGLNKRLIFISSPTYIVSRDKWKNLFQSGDIYIIDEAHDCLSPGYKTMIGDIPKTAQVIGVSATFLKGYSGEGHNYWDKIIHPFSGYDYLDMGYLPRLELIRMQKEDADRVLSLQRGIKLTSGDYNKKQLFSKRHKLLFGNLIDHYNIFNPDRKPAIAFCINIEHTKEIAQEFQKASVSPLLINSKLSAEEKKEFTHNLDYYLKSEIPFIICSVDMLSRGVDIPQLKVGIMLRPTKSEILFLQQVGRLTRKFSPDPSVPETVTLIDHTINSYNFPHPYDHHTPHTSDEENKKARKKSNVSMRICKECGAVNPPHLSHCIVCNFELITKLEIKHLNLSLRKATISEKEEKILARLKQENYIYKKYPNLDKNWKYRKVLKVFGKEACLKSKHFPEDFKNKLIDKDIPF